MENKKLNKIGRGWQYTIYDKGPRVIKIPNSIQTVRKIMLRGASPKTISNKKKFESALENLIKDRQKSLRWLQKSGQDLEILGNPLIKKNKIEQDNVVTLGQILKKSENGERYIRGFIELIFECWKNGFSEKVYNLTINNGVTKDGKVILIDFGEITFEKKKVIKRMQRFLKR